MIDGYDRRGWREAQIKWYREQIEWSNKEIEWLNEKIEWERKESKELQKYVWSRGVLTEMEMRMWGNLKKPYKSKEQRMYESHRNREYRNRKKYERYIAEYEVELAEM